MVVWRFQNEFLFVLVPWGGVWLGPFNCVLPRVSENTQGRAMDDRRTYKTGHCFECGGPPEAAQCCRLSKVVPVGPGVVISGKGPLCRRAMLSEDCRITLFDTEVVMAESIDFQYGMKKNCTDEITKFCKDISHGRAKVIRCLEDNMDKPEFGPSCKASVEKHIQHAAQDYRCVRASNHAAVTHAMLCCAVPCCAVICGVSCVLSWDFMRMCALVGSVGRRITVGTVGGHAMLRMAACRLPLTLAPWA